MHKPVRPHRLATVASIVSVLALVMTSTGGSALAAPNPRWYHVAISPGVASPGSTSSFTFKLTNGTASARSIGSANISVPAGFRAVGVPTISTFNSDNSPAGLTWSAALGSGGSTVELRNPGPSKTQRLSFGQYVLATFDAIAPCAPGSYVWKSVVRETNDFHNNGVNFTIPPSDTNPKVTVSSGQCVDHLAFGGQPSDTLAGSTMSPAVTVEELDASDHVLTGDNTSTISLQIGANPGSSTLTGGGSQTVVNGVATFSGLSLNNSSSGYTLVATYDPIPSIQATSDPFDITSTAPNCNPCNTTTGNGSTVSGGQDTTLVVEGQSIVDCDAVFAGFDSTDPPPIGSGGKTPPFEGTVTVNVGTEYTASNPDPVVFSDPSSVVGLPSMQVYPSCEPIPGAPAEGPSDPHPGQLPGQQIPACTAPTNNPGGYPCVLSQGFATPSLALVTVVDYTNGDPPHKS